MMIGPTSFLAPRPYVPECDFSGEVLDENETELEPGDSVYGCVPNAIRLSTRQGALSQYIRVPSSCLVKRPPNITPIEAAGVTIAALTSYQAIHHIANVEPEQTVFINGGSSATGAFAIQIAKAKSARVLATASGKNEQFIRNLGADEVCPTFIKGPNVDIGLPSSLIIVPKSLSTNILFSIFLIRNIMSSTTLSVSPILLFSLGVKNTSRLMESLFPTIHFPKIFQFPNYGKD
jgi:hypothetical protein